MTIKRFCIFPSTHYLVGSIALDKQNPTKYKKAALRKKHVAKRNMPMGRDKTVPKDSITSITMRIHGKAKRLTNPSSGYLIKSLISMTHTVLRYVLNKASPIPDLKNVLFIDIDLSGALQNSQLSTAILSPNPFNSRTPSKS